ncbi:hypothetical protein LCGC14_1951930 [marine sediment metagenome]|uniref:HTH cro/C1-type domain-containing protein n=1 Tax=marine sediment metagenome TaxID=412755 RepID=A0A0F9HVP1_9ZZZZ
MKLSDYLKEQALTLSAFAEAVGLDVSTVHRAATGKVIPTRENMAAIVKATDGAVQPNDFYSNDTNKGGPRQPEPQEAA